MARLSATVGISSCTTQRNEYETRFPEPKAFSAFESVFRPVVDSPPHRSEAEGRPKKRRRTHNGDQAGGGQPYDPEKSALLAKITLDLVPSKSQTLPALEDDARASVVLHLAAFKKEQDHLALSVVEPVSSTTLQVSATADDTVLEPLATHLTTAALVGAESDESSPSSRKDYIPFSRCVLSAPTSGRPSIQLDVELRWPFGVSLADIIKARFSQRANSNILSTYFTSAATEDRSSWTLADFYDAVHVPPLDSHISPRIESSLPSTHLYPYQQRSVDWMLRREGTKFSSTGEIQEIPRRTADTVPVSFSATTDIQGRKCYVSHVRGMLIPDISQEWDSTALPGGILAEEMGLGKSVELISLICLNKRDITKEDVYDPYLAKTVKASGATLIITPPAILGQWITEVNKHAPQLKCFHYRGFSQHTQEEATVEHLLQFDVVLTSYDVLSKEIHHATPPPERSLRRAKVHERRISPLVDISWWRVCLDEAQMVEKGVSQAATMARTIPRCNAWAVSGTPLRTNITDLVGLLVFLRCEPFASVKDHFARLDKTSFRDLINRIALRHTKDQIRGDLDIPPQRRVVITVPFTAIEAEYYKDMYRQMYEACFLSPEGVPLREDRGIDHPETIERMREWLVRLRQTCLHSHVGEKNRKALGPKRQPLRTVQEVLQVMIDQNETKLKSEVREMILAQMKRGHICSFAFNFPKEQAILYYQEALKTTLEYVKLGREEIQAEVARIRQSDPSSSDHEESDDEDEKDETNAKFARMVTLRRSLRSFLELEHACYFFIGNMYFQWKENIALTVPDSAEYDQREKSEKEWYDKAQLIRQELLKDTEKRTQRQMQKVRNMKARYQDLELPEIEDLGGIESSNVLEKLDVITNIINEQSVKLKEWRNKIIEMSTTSLVDNAEDKDTTGEEYETSLKIQDELYVYIQALRTIVADMNTAVQGTQDTLVNHEMDQAVRQAQDEDITRRGHAPELLLRLANERAPLRAKPQNGSLKGVVGSARQLVASLQHRAEAGDKRAVVELAIAQKYLAQTQDMFSARTELLADLEKEQEQFRLTMNMRLEFYRQIQHISDTVEDYQEEMDEVFDHDAFQLQTIMIEARKIAIQRFKVKQTYLNNLRGGAEEPKAECKICMDEYERGILTACGHRVSTFLHALLQTPLQALLQSLPAKLNHPSTAETASSPGGKQLTTTTARNAAQPSREPTSKTSSTSPPSPPKKKPPPPPKPPPRSPPPPPPPPSTPPSTPPP